MIRRGLAIAALLMAWPSAAAAAIPWQGGGAPDGIAGDLLAVESDGTLVASTFNDNIAIAPPGRPFRPVAPGEGFQDPIPPASLLAVAGGLRAFDLDGGLWASSDHGRTWAFVSDLGSGIGEPNDGTGVLSVAIDPAHPNLAVRIHADGGVQRSTDGGASWFSALPLDPPELGDDLALVTGAVFTPAGDLDVQMGSRLWRSADLGDSWQRLPNAPAGLIESSPAAAGVFWIAARSGVFRSDDGGLTWHRRHVRTDQLVLSAADPSVAWAQTRTTTEITTDGGATWRRLANAPPGIEDAAPSVALPGRARSLCMLGGQSLWCSDGGPFRPDAARVDGLPSPLSDLAPDPFRPGRAIALTSRQVWETVDGGATWRGLAAPTADYVTVVLTRAGTFLSSTRGVRFQPRGSRRWLRRPGPRGFVDLAADPVSGAVYARTPGKVWRAAGAGQFRRVAGVGASRDPFADLSIGARGRTVVVRASSGRVDVSTDGGALFHVTHPPTGPLVVASPRAPARLVAAGPRGIAVSTDAGASWHRRAVRAVVALTADPRHAERWYAVSASGQLLASRDDARTWRAVVAVPHDRSFAPFGALLSVAAGRVWLSMFAEPSVWSRPG